MKALVIIDVQNDFCPGGALAVPEGDAVVPVINEIGNGYDVLVATRDWHPEGHVSFASRHGKEPGTQIKLDIGEQMLWPDHCRQSSRGADFHPDLDIRRVRCIIHKGFRPELDSYSAFYENDGSTSTGLGAYLNGLGVKEVHLCGLATDYCVAFSALDAVREGFETSVLLEACRGVGVPERSVETSLERMEKAGVNLVHV